VWCETADVLREIRPGAWPVVGRLVTANADRNLPTSAVALLVDAAQKYPQADVRHYLQCALAALAASLGHVRQVRVLNRLRRLVDLWWEKYVDCTEPRKKRGEHPKNIANHLYSDVDWAFRRVHDEIDRRAAILRSRRLAAQYFAGLSAPASPRQAASEARFAETVLKLPWLASDTARPIELLTRWQKRLAAVPFRDGTRVRKAIEDKLAQIMRAALECDGDLTELFTASIASQEQDSARTGLVS